MPQAFPLVIAGGNNLVAPYLMQRLRAKGLTAEVISRNLVEVPEGFTFTKMDLTMARNWIAPENAVVVSLLPMSVLAQFLPRFIGIKSMIAVGSASHFLKVKSENPQERVAARNINIAESMLREWWSRSNVQSTLLRGVMIYDGANDYNIVRIARFIKRYRCFPLAAPAKGLRRPVHADDVAKAIINCLNNDAVHGKDLNIGGGEIMTYRVMIERIFAAMGYRPRCWMLQTGALKKAVEWVSKTELIHDAFFSAAVFQRMNEDLIMDLEEGLQLLRYEPRGFSPKISI